MGITDKDAAIRAARLNPQTTEPKKERGHARGQTDDRRLQDTGLRGIPCVGAGPGVIKGTKPGDSARALDQAARDILTANLNRNRYKPT